MKIHCHPPLCFLDIEGEDITCSKDINNVTCQFCSYYFFHPEAKELERQFREKNHDKTRAH